MRQPVSQPKPLLEDTHVLGPNPHICVLRPDESDQRSWLQGSPICPVLAEHQIAHLGLAEARWPYRVIRTEQSGTYFIACTEGSGRIMIDGHWRTCGAGQACLLPPGVMNAFEARRRGTWRFAWVRYAQPKQQKPIATASVPVLAPFNGVALEHAIHGLWEECRHGISPATQQDWARVIQTYVLKFAQPRRMDDRLWNLWLKVSATLGEPWSIERMSHEAHMSGEHLRRMCQREFGRSPMQQVSHLRLERAAHLLKTTSLKIETISHQIGYQNPFVFSNTFKTWSGYRPSEYRAGAETRHPRPATQS